MYEDTTYEVILQRMLDRVSSSMDKREGSVIWDTHSPTAIELYTLYTELDYILTQAYGDTAGRDYLVLRCAERGITPYEATCAVLQGEFTPTDIDVTGQRFSIGDLNYVVGDKISDGVYYVTCETAGTVGNQYLGQMIPIDYIDGLETAELTAVLIPGEDDEDVEALRERYFASFDSQSFGGNLAAYIEETNGIQGVAGCKVKRAWNGDISPSAMIPNEAIQDWFSGIIGTLEGDVKDWLQTVYTAAAEKKLTVGGTVLVTVISSEYSAPSDALIDLAQTTLDPEQNAGEGYGLAPIGHVVTVQGVSEAEINVTVTVTFESGYSWSNLQSSIESAVDDYLLELRQAWADSEYLVVRVSQVENHILGVAGVIDAQYTKVNGSEENLTLGEYDIPVLGGVSG